MLTLSRRLLLILHFVGDEHKNLFSLRKDKVFQLFAFFYWSFITLSETFLSSSWLRLLFVAYPKVVSQDTPR